MKFKKGDRVRVYGQITDSTFYSYSGVDGIVKEVSSTCLYVAFDGDDPRLSHCCLTNQVHNKQCRKLKRRKNSGAI